MKYSLFYLCFIFLASSCESKSKSSSINKVDRNGKDTAYIFQTFETTDYGWGYCIFKGAKKILNQPHIPAIQGNRGFRTQEDATSVAKLVLDKINQGNFPPTVTEKEMIDLGIQL